MSTYSSVRTQGGAITIFICMMMLIFMTLMVVSAYSISTVNLQSVSNAQAREESIAAAQSVIEQVVASSFTDNPTVAALDDFPVDINNDGINDYWVDLAVPVCVRATRANTKTASSVTLPGMTAVDAWNTIWELDAIAVATDPDGVRGDTGARVRVRQGVRKLLSELEKDLVCS
jgi:hypothetical protein